MTQADALLPQVGVGLFGGCEVYRELLVLPRQALVGVTELQHLLLQLPGVTVGGGGLVNGGARKEGSR